MRADGDLNVDGHHTIEDTGIVLGEAIAKAVGNKKGIKRYGFSLLPMDETLIECAVDLCGRAAFVTNVVYTSPFIGDFETEMAGEFFKAVSDNARMALHLHQVEGINNHHLAEASFKSFAKALDMAVSFDQRITDVLSTKGTI